MIKKLPIICSFVLFFGIEQSFSQCSMVEVPLTQRIQNSTVIIEGKVINKISFWNSQHTLIFTSNSIEVYKSFKGKITSKQVELITEGGTVGDKMHVVEPSLQLNEGETGVFFVEPSSIVNSQNFVPLNLKFQPYAGTQGFVRYDLASQTASDPFKKYNTIKTEIYNRIETETGQKYSVLKSFNISASQNYSKQFLLTPSITSFAPATITAGTGSIITITGTGFGATQGTSVVQFKNADNGGSTYIQPAASQYVLWSDTQIQVKVPTKTSSSGSAGTGTIQVIVSSITATSGSSLTISYNEINLESSSIIYQTEHVNDNGAGGYTWQMFTGFDGNAPAKVAFTRALSSLRCGTYINWQTGTTTSINTIANDGTNVVRFDIGAELAAGLLGRCSSYYTGCGSPLVWYVTELDIVFDDAATWNYLTAAPSGSESDFESVALHELGHGHQFGHVINTNDVMHFSITTGTSRRVLSPDNINAGNDVMSRSIVNNTCGPTAMIALTAGNCNVGAPVAGFTATPTNSCASSLAVTFSDQSTGSPTSWAWDIDNNGSTDYSTSSPSHTYSSVGTYSVKLTVTNTNGNDSIIKTNYITVGSAALPFTEDFENATFPPLGWSITQSPTDAITWTRNTAAAGNGTSTACASINYFNYSSASGEKDNLISKPVSLVGPTSATLTFKVAYKNYPNTANHDTLRVYVSADCGSTYGTAVYTKGGNILATAGSSASAFIPAVSGDWRTETISLNSFVGNNIVLKFEGTNRWGNNFYIDDINITGGSLPVADFIANTTIMCAGQCINFTDQSTNSPTSWTWSFAGAVTASSVAQSPANICYNTAGTYNVSLTATNGFGPDIETKTAYITVNPLPPTPIINQNGNILTSSVTATSYQWNLNGAPVLGATSISYTATIAGNYTVAISDANGCSVTSSVLNFTTTGIENATDNALTVSVYPNPFSTTATVEIKGKRKMENGKCELRMYDLLGKEVYQSTVINSKTEIHKGDLSSGIYLYKVFNKNEIIGKGKITIK